MPVGNDIVDLRDPENQPHAIHPRFDERAFTEVERRHLTDRDAAHRTRWLLWSAKEAAFKAARKLDAGVRFLPRRFAVDLQGDEAASVTHAAGRFRVSFCEADDWLHAVASLAAGGSRRRRSAPLSLVEQVRVRATSCDASKRVREVARARIGRLLSIPSREIRIVTRDGIPLAYRGPVPLPVDLSMSHHGRFLALALARTGEEGGGRAAAG